MAIRTTCVGSWPIPFGLRPALKRYYAGILTDEDADGLLSRAARISMDEMISCGVDQSRVVRFGDQISFIMYHHGSQVSKLCNSGIPRRATRASADIKSLAMCGLR